MTTMMAGPAPTEAEAVAEAVAGWLTHRLRAVGPVLAVEDGPAFDEAVAALGRVAAGLADTLASGDVDWGREVVLAVEGAGWCDEHYRPPWGGPLGPVLAVLTDPGRAVSARVAAAVLGVGCHKTGGARLGGPSTFGRLAALVRGR